MSTSLGQQRAEFALKQLEELTCNRSDFKSFSAGLPTMILQNGFGQTLAFLVAKASKEEKGKISFKEDDKHYAAFTIIKEWLCNQAILTPGNAKDILVQISKMDQKDYLRAQQETLAMLQWLKRYANAALFGE